MATFMPEPDPNRSPAPFRPEEGGSREVLVMAVVAILCGWGAGGAWAADLTPSMGRPATERKHLALPPDQRAGRPKCISPLARPTESPHEKGYFIGGGARERSRGSCERGEQEGVWGTDYTGIIIPKHVDLRWWHGQRAQGGAGAYQTDGPRVLRQHH